MITFPDFEEGTGPILMLNMVKFKDRRLYFKDHIPAFYRVVKDLGIQNAKIFLSSDVLANIVASEGENWDAVVLVEYPSFAAFKTMSDSYQTIAKPLRAAAVEDTKLFVTRRTED
ncbi:hypothetical protein EA772_13950 [Pedobacter sp. G11]|uniref:hypothetical protein n=1 Tax=Pedobacter sp. G11 TaxID=2482728 RepID=UPI000F5DCE4A|nr:hypothetical protein [Pedobacter sp. G11]AZI26388.1 hypothetical protein EA772_13950 [Pedobacter sp. G11]